MSYLLSLVIPTVVISCSYFGLRYGYADSIAYVPLVLVYLAPPIINRCFVAPGSQERVATPDIPRSWLRLLPVASVPAQFLMLYFALEFWNMDTLGLSGRVGWIFSVGVFSALFAINMGHELIHRPSKFEQIMGGIILSSVCFGSFKTVHLKIHHRYAGTPLDFASSDYRQSLYSYWRQALAGNFFRAVATEVDYVRKPSKYVWHSELLWWSIVSLFVAVLVYVHWGMSGLIFFLAQSLVAILKLEMINYLQHYGLRRKNLGDSKYEPMSAHHAWSQTSSFTNFVMINLLRHSDHHLNPKRSYDALEDLEDGPKYPYDFSVVCLLSLFPPIFIRVADKELANMRRTEGFRP